MTEKKEKHEEQQYLDILRDLLEKGDERITRNGKVLSLFGNRCLTFDLQKGFPLLTTKKMFFRGIVEELLFFIRGQTNTKILEEKGVSIWKGNTSREFLDGVGLYDYPEGDMGPMYGYIWRHFGKPYKSGNDGESKGIDQLQYVLDTIVNDPFSRRILMTTFNPAQVHQGCLYPCHSIVVQFYVRQMDNVFYLSQQTYIRSNDIFLGNPYNIASSALLSHLICHHLNGKINPSDPNGRVYKVDQLHVVLGDYHLYEPHYEVARQQLQRTPHPFPQLQFKVPPRENIEDYTYEDLVLIHYCSEGLLKAPMVA
jgi:thymidylate synthase